MEKLIFNIARYLTAILFIFSGLVKAIDPIGLAYKMQEFFEAWSNDGFLPGLMELCNNHALLLSIGMITLEVFVGLALLLGWKKKIVLWILLALIIFFTFLTSYVLFSGKIRACGCFGDCIPLTPVQTFSKDIILLLFSILLLFNKKYILPPSKPYKALFILLAGTISTIGIQFYVMKHLPLVDCLPYKKGNNILDLRKMPLNAVPDKYDIVFIYQKNGQKREFPVSALPDSSWEFVDRQQKLISLGKNNTPLINDFSITTSFGTDTTESILSQPNEYFLLFIRDVETHSDNWDNDFQLIQKAQKSKKKIYIITSQRELINEKILKQKLISKSTNPILVFSCDATAIKTAARNNPTFYKMNGPLVVNKWGPADFSKVRF